MQRTIALIAFIVLSGCSALGNNVIVREPVLGADGNPVFNRFGLMVYKTTTTPKEVVTIDSFRQMAALRNANHNDTEQPEPSPITCSTLANDQLVQLAPTAQVEQIRAMANCQMMLALGLIVHPTEWIQQKSWQPRPATR